METELERLVVRLTGDGSDFMRMLQLAERQSKETADKVGASARVVEDFGKSLHSFAGTTVAALSTLGVGMGLWSSFMKFEDAEKSMRRLSATMEMNGGNVQAGIREYQEFARSITDTTLAGRDQVMGLLRQAETMGMSGQAAQDAARFSLGFGEATGMSAEHSLRLAAAVQTGNAHLLQHIPQLRQYTSAHDKLAAAQRMAAMGARMMEAEFNTAGGQLERLKRSLGSLTKDLGGMVATFINPLVSWIQRAVESFNNLDPPVKRTVVSVLLLVGSIRPLMSLLPMMTSLFSEGSAVMSVLGLATSMYQGVVSGLVYLAMVPARAVMLTWNAVMGVLWATTSIGTTVMSLLEFSIHGVTSAFRTLLVATGIGVALIIIAGAVTMIVQSMGGWSQGWKKLQDMAKAAWEYIKLALEAFVEWATPMWKAWMGVMAAGWDLLKRAFVAAMSFVVGVFSGAMADLTTAGRIDWDKVRDHIVKGLVAVEFGFNQIKDVATTVWAWVKLQFWSYVGRPLTEFFTVTLPGFFGQFTGVAQQEMRMTDAALLREYNELQGSLSESYSQFQERRMREINAANEVSARAAEAGGTRIGQGLTRGTEKEMHKFNAVMFGSAEAVSRLAEWQDKVSRPGTVNLMNQSVTAPLAAATATVTNFLGNLNESFGTIGTTWMQMGRDFWDSVTRWGANFWRELTGQGQGWWSQFIQGAREAWSVASTIGANTWQYLRRSWDQIVLGQHGGISAWMREILGETDAQRRTRENVQYTAVDTQIAQAALEAFRLGRGGGLLSQQHVDILGVPQILSVVENMEEQIRRNPGWEGNARYLAQIQQLLASPNVGVARQLTRDLAAIENVRSEDLGGLRDSLADRMTPEVETAIANRAIQEGIDIPGLTSGQSDPQMDQQNALLAQIRDLMQQVANANNPLQGLGLS